MRHFAAFQAGCARLQHARLPDLTFMECGCLAVPGPPDRQWSAIFRGPGHETTYVGRVKLTIEPILSRVAAWAFFAVPSLARWVGGDCPAHFVVCAGRPAPSKGVPSLAVRHR